jgi:hypothetical protein
MNVEHEMYDYTGNNLSHQHSNKRFQETFGRHTRKSFNTITTKDMLYLEHRTQYGKHSCVRHYLQQYVHMATYSLFDVTSLCDRRQDRTFLFPSLRKPETG